LLQAKEILDHDLLSVPSINQLSRQVCLNEFKLKKGFKQLFKEWLKKAEEGARNEIVPQWHEIESMKETCFPRIAFKHYLTRNNVEYKLSPKTQIELDIKQANLICPYQAASSRIKIYNMRSYTPQTIAMIVCDKPNNDNKNLQRYVDHYVSKLSF
jgi:hypothetical protein